MPQPPLRSSPEPAAPVAALAAYLADHGLQVTVWKGRRAYLHGYGRDIDAYLEPGGSTPGAAPADGARLVVTSSWRSKHNGLRCKGVKHAILKDLYTAGAVSARPPDDWRQVRLDDAPAPAGRRLRPA